MMIVHLAGHEVPVEFSATLNSEGGILGILIDCTERKLAEAGRLELAREQQARVTAEQLLRVSRILGTELNLEKLLRSVTDVATKLIGAEFGAFCFRCREDQSNALGALSEPDREASRWSQSPGAAALFESTLNGGRTVRVNDVLVDERYGRLLPYFDMPSNDTPARSFLAVPVISKEREVVGGLFFGHSKVGVFTEHHGRVAEGVAAEAAMAIENARLSHR